MRRGRFPLRKARPHLPCAHTHLASARSRLHRRLTAVRTSADEAVGPSRGGQATCAVICFAVPRRTPPPGGDRRNPADWRYAARPEKSSADNALCNAGGMVVATTNHTTSTRILRRPEAHQRLRWRNGVLVLRRVLAMLSRDPLCVGRARLLPSRKPPLGRSLALPKKRSTSEDFN